MAPLAKQIIAGDGSVDVFAGRDTHTEEDRAQWGTIAIHTLDRAGPVAFGYLPGLVPQLQGATLDVLHSHGLWMYPSVAAQRWGKRNHRPWVISPHGMLDPWALKNARWKKQLAARLYENRHLRGAACLHALCEAEADAFRAYGLKNPIAVIPNGVDLPVLPEQPITPDWAHELPEHARVLLFMGRLHPKKGLPALLDAWARVANMADNSWFLVIAGWDQNDHRATLEQKVSALGLARNVRFVGPQFGEQKAASLLRANAFVLPSFSEGLPMAVLEAWSYGLPVLMSPQCNLPEGFSAVAAIRAEPEVESLCSGLETLFKMSDTDLKRMGERGRALVEARFTWPQVAEQMCAVYRWVLGNDAKPECVRLAL